jgi:hypothetical protein
MHKTEYRKNVGGRVVKRFVAEPEQLKIIDNFLRLHCTELSKAIRGCQGRPVTVLGDVDEEMYNVRVQEFGAKPLDGKPFASAAAAARHMGLPDGSVSHALFRARRAGKDFAIIAGVPLCYVDEIKGVD